MPSILSNNLAATDIQGPMQAANDLASQIMATPNPQVTFNNLLNQNPELKKMYDLMNQYGNNDPKAAFMNYMGSTGKQTFGQMIIQWLGNKFGL